MSDPMCIYISGPMRGYPEFNFREFDKAKIRLLRAYPDAAIISPADRDRNNGFDPTGLTGDEDLEALGFSFRAALADDLATICLKATRVYMLHGWRNSGGATAEWYTAHVVGLKVIYQDAGVV